MKKQTFILILVLLMLVSGIGIVSAAEYSGTFTPDVTTTTVDLWVPSAGGYTNMGNPTNQSIMFNVNFSVVGEPESLLFYSGTDFSLQGSAAFTINDTAGDYATGTMYCQNGTSMYGTNKQYWYFVFDTWNNTGRSGVTRGQLRVPSWTGTTSYDSSPFKYTGGNQINAKVGLNNQAMGFGVSPASDTIYFNDGFYTRKPISINYDYIFTKQSGSGSSQITKAEISKVDNNEENKISFFNSSGVLLYRSTVSSSSGNETIFIVGAPFYLSAYDVGWDKYYNTTELFYPLSVTPTPTPTPTPTVTLGPGQFWITFAAEDATTGGLVPGAEIDIYSHFLGTWDNATTSTGERKIASSPDNYYDVYGSASGYVNGSNTNLMAFNNAYYLIHLFPSTGLPSIPGEVNLFVSVTERETGAPIAGATVTVNTPGSYTVTGETDENGVEVFSTSNSSVKYITVEKTGYRSETRTITTPATGNYNAVLQMSRLTVTTVPTSYIPPGGVTPVRTVDPRSAGEKDVDMMNQIRDAGPDLISLAIAVTFISLLGLMVKGFGK